MSSFDLPGFCGAGSIRYLSVTCPGRLQRRQMFDVEFEPGQLTREAVRLLRRNRRAHWFFAGASV